MADVKKAGEKVAVGAKQAVHTAAEKTEEAARKVKDATQGK